MDGRSAIAIISTGASAQVIAAGATLRPRLGTTVVEHALHRLREECESRGKLWLFQALSCHLTDERDELSYAKLSAELGMAETAVKKQLHTMRQRYRSLLRDEVSRTVEDPSDVDDEIRYLCVALATGTG